MTLVLFSLALGIAIGVLLRNSPRIVSKSNLLTYSGLFFLLLVMGAQLGSNAEVLSGLADMGKQAFIIALLSVAGSVLLVQLASGYIRTNLRSAPKDRGIKVGD